ncbi:hypothetical protein P4908_09665 [Pantoea ananatis]|nr:hypothetical protein [Pantoea ananatis]MDF7790502.1 hypothetical protein [Pantoea ananatis]
MTNALAQAEASPQPAVNFYEVFTRTCLLILSAIVLSERIK